MTDEAFVFVLQHDKWKRWSGPWSTKERAQKILGGAQSKHPSKKFRVVSGILMEHKYVCSNLIHRMLTPNYSELEEAT